MSEQITLYTLNEIVQQALDYVESMNEYGVYHSIEIGVSDVKNEPLIIVNYSMRGVEHSGSFRLKHKAVDRVCDDFDMASLTNTLTTGEDICLEKLVHPELCKDLVGVWHIPKRILK